MFSSSATKIASKATENAFKIGEMATQKVLLTQFNSIYVKFSD